MSLIEEALRRAQETEPPKPTTARRPDEPSIGVHPWPTKPGERPVTPPPRSTKALIVMAAIILAGAALLAVGGARWLAGAFNAQRRAASPYASDASLPTGRHAAMPSRLIQQERFVLSGVVEGGGTAHAVINGQVVGIGETVNGATLHAIAGETVRLATADGEELVLRLAH